MRIAVFVENRPFFGALLVHAPLLWELKAQYPGCRTTLFAPFPQAELLVRADFADELVVYRRGLLPMTRRLRAGLFEAIYNLRPATRWLDLALGLCGAAERRGFDSFLGRIVYTTSAPHDTSIYRPRKYLTLLGGAVATGPLDGFLRAIAPTGQTSEKRRTLLLLPGGGEPYKLWGIERYLELCTTLSRAQPDLEFTFILGPAEAPLQEAIVAWNRSVIRPAEIVMNAALESLAAIALGATAAVGNDCGPAHIVQMCGRPFACVMSDHDGRGAERIAEWVDAANHTFTVVSSPGQPLASVAVKDVLAAVERALAPVQDAP